MLPGSLANIIELCGINQRKINLDKLLNFLYNIHIKVKVKRSSYKGYYYWLPPSGSRFESEWTLQPLTRGNETDI